MAVVGAQVSVGTTATALNAGGIDADTDNRAGQSVTFWSSVALSLGGSGVTWSTGAQLPANTPLTIDLEPGEVVYAAVQTGTATTHVVRQGA